MHTLTKLNQFYDLGHVLRAQDIRKLRPCALCGGIGYLPQMLVLGSGPAHGTCVVAAMSENEILALPRCEAEKLRLNEISKDLMLKLLWRADASQPESAPVAQAAANN